MKCHNKYDLVTWDSQNQSVSRDIMSREAVGWLVKWATETSKVRLVHVRVFEEVLKLADGARSWVKTGDPTQGGRSGSARRWDYPWIHARVIHVRRRSPILITLSPNQEADVCTRIRVVPTLTNNTSNRALLNSS